MATIGPLSFKGGLNSREGLFNLPKDQCITFTDARVLGGRVYPRNSNTTTLGTFTVSSNTGTGFFWVDPSNIKSTNNAAITVVLAGQKYQTAPWGGDDAAQTFTDRTGATTVPNNSFPASFASLNSILVTTFLDNSTGVTPLQLTAYNVNAANLSGSPPKAGVCLAVNNFLFLGANYTSASTMSRVYWSNVADPQTWGASNFLDCGPNDGDFITGLGSIGTDLYIFKTNSIWKLSTVVGITSGTVTLGPLVQISKSIGVSGHQSIDNLPDGSIVFFSSNNHLFHFDGANFEDLSDPPYPSPSIQPSLTSLYNVSPLLTASASSGPIVKVYKSKNEIWISGKSNNGVVNDTTYALNFSERYWSKHNLNANINSLFTSGTTRPGITSGFTDRLCYLTQQGTLAVLDTAQSTNTSQELVTTSISLLGSDDKFIPRSLIIPVEITGTPSVIVLVGFDNSTLTTMYNGTPNEGSLVVPIKMLIPQSSAVRPCSIQIQLNISLTHSSDTVYVPYFYLSDEVLN